MLVTSNYISKGLYPFFLKGGNVGFERLKIDVSPPMVKTPTTSPRFLPASIVVSWGKNSTVMFNPIGHYPPPPMYKPFKFLQATMATLQ